MQTLAERAREGDRASTGLTFTLIKSTVVAALGGLLFGFDTAVIAGTTRALSETYGLSPAMLGVTVASALWGTVAGSILAGNPAERFGRRTCLHGLAVLYALSAGGCALAWDWPSLVFFRFVGGLAIGGSSVVGPMYIAEIAPAKMRGRLVAFFQFNVVLGILLAYFSNYVVGQLALGAAEWRFKLGVVALPAVVFFLALFTIPRSPRWLAKRGLTGEARAVLAGLGERDVEGALGAILQSIGTERTAGRQALFRRKYRVPILLAVSVSVFNQLSGINAILYYLNDIFERAGFSKVSSDRQAVIIGLTFLVFTVAAMSVIDRLGRKKLLLTGAVGTAVCLAGIAMIVATQSRPGALLWLLVGYIAFFAFSQGTVIWVYISEVFPNAVRAKGQSLGSFTHWFMDALIAGAFPVLAAYSWELPFLFYAVMMVAQFFVVLLLFPETKGITLEDMQKKLGIG